MLELRKTENEDAVRSFCQYSNLLYTDEYESYAALDRGKLVGYCIFQLGGTLTIVDVGVKEEYGAELCDGLVRAVFHYASASGVNSAIFADVFDDDIWKLLQPYGYTDKSVHDIDNFLSNCKKCGH
ncbi:GNAT family N-acetyltransferase [Hydrogenoanaerobacterium sp.]|uniref:GNAT family N-acetyltransferase n=1 Tax=Hydrogenoanaerobacterium sp. TaxID=2953763 RepID=UPI002896BB77|nr:GNAT family N-acetyltransferase [Hydrogenoanaerobacterium sp.]